MNYQKEYEQGAGRFTASDLSGLMDKAKTVQAKAGKLGQLFNDVMTALSLLKDYVAGRYTQIPWRIVAGLGFALAYVVNPFDLVPDFLPGLGYLDDAAVFGLAISLARPDVAAYKQWKEKRSNPSDEDRSSEES